MKILYFNATFVMFVEAVENVNVVIVFTTIATDQFLDSRRDSLAYWKSSGGIGR
jgi:hypothetical protein